MAIFISLPFLMILSWLWENHHGGPKEYLKKFVKILYPTMLLISIIISIVTIYWAYVYWNAINSPQDSQTQLNFLSNYFSFWEIRVDFGLLFGCFILVVSALIYAKLTYNERN
jgi:hypothetical protein